MPELAEDDRFARQEALHVRKRTGGVASGGGSSVFLTTTIDREPEEGPEEEPEEGTEEPGGHSDRRASLRARFS